MGEHRTKNNSLRSNDNVLAVSAVVGDYDAEKIALEIARERLEVLGVRAIFYTSGRHTPDTPRWRVIAPLSAPLPKEDHPRLAAR